MLFSFIGGMHKMKKALVMDYLLDKGGYCYIQKSRNEVTALKYVKPEFVSLSIDPNPLHKNIISYGKIYKSKRKERYE